MNRKTAIIDLGSNSIRLIIMKTAEDGSYKLVEQEKEMVRLSRGMTETGRLQEEAVAKTIHTLKLFKRLIDSHRAYKIICVATAAVRQAVNSNDFLQRVKKETGFDFRIISGDEEAYLDFLGVINSFGLNDFIIVDIGGASTEIILVRERNICEQISLPMGAVSVTEKFFGQKRFNEKERAARDSFISSRLDEAGWLFSPESLPVIGVGGTMRSIAKIDRKRKNFPLNKLHYYQIPADDVRKILEELENKTPGMRKRTPGLDRNRADIINGGLAILEAVMTRTGAPELIVSGNGLREGLFYRSHFGDDIIDDVLMHSIDILMKNYDISETHSSHVCKLAMEIFRQTKKLHNLDPKTEKLLFTGAMLHDIGIYVDYYNHHNHGFYLMLNSALYGLTIREILICAFIVGSHRDKSLKANPRSYTNILHDEDRLIIDTLSLFVRTAENLDRNEQQSVKSLEIEYLPDKNLLNFVLVSNENCDLEIAACMKSEKYFRKLLGTGVRFRQKGN